MSLSFFQKIFVLVLILFFLFFFSSLYIWQVLYTPKDISSEEFVLFKIEKGQGIREISQNLKNQGLIKSALFFNFYVWISGKRTHLKAGSYYLSPNMSIVEIADKIKKGEVVKTKFTILEGWGLKDIIKALVRKKIYSEEEFLSALGSLEIKNYISQLETFKDKPKDLSFEGYFFPDTYEVFEGLSVQDFIKSVFLNFDKKLKPYLTEIKKQEKSVFEIITMASLIEKEVRSLEDKKIVSGILWKRLKIGMPLQVDATISYITGRKSVKISIEETKIDSPYNTYKYKGLPLGPISNPGLESIIAALKPKESSYFYYLSAPEGKTIFSKTLEEHNIAKKKYLK